MSVGTPLKKRLSAVRGMEICVFGSTARLSTSRMTCQSLRNVPVLPVRCPAALLWPFPHLSRSDLQLCRGWIFNIFSACSSLSPSGEYEEELMTLGSEKEEPRVWAQAEPGVSPPPGRVVSSRIHTQSAWISICSQSVAGQPLSGVQLLPTSQLS